MRGRKSGRRGTRSGKAESADAPDSSEELNARADKGEIIQAKHGTREREGAMKRARGL